MPKKQKPSPAEWEVLKVIWNLNEATSRKVSDVLFERFEWENATTKTLLGRLVKKGYLETRSVGNKFIYTATVSEDESVEYRVHRVFSSICQTSVGSAITSVINDFDLTFEDKAMILEALSQKDFEEELVCDCIQEGRTVCDCKPGECHCKDED